MAASKVQHIARFAVQDWRTSRVRSRSAMTADPVLRVVYLEILFALYEAGGELPSDPAELEDVLLLPAADISRCLPLLSKIGENGRGGIVIDGHFLRNRRVTDDISEQKEYRSKQAKHGKKRWFKGTSSTGYPEATLRPPSTDPEATLRPPLGSEEGSLSQPKPKPPPTPKPKPSFSHVVDEASCASEQKDDSSATDKPPPEPPVLEFPCSGKPNTWGLTSKQVAEWEALYPAIDVPAECRKALAWIRANNRKTAKGMSRFLVGWLGRATDRGGGSRTNGNGKSPPRSERGNPGASEEIMEYATKLQNDLGDW